MSARWFWSPLLAVVLAAATLAGPLSARASADGSVSGGPGTHVAFSTTTTEGICPECVLYSYNVWLTYGYYANYVTSYLYTDKWQLGTRNLNGCVELPNTYPDSFTVPMRYQVYNPGGTLAFNWYTSDFGPGDGLCQSGQQIFAYKRTTYQEYVNKGGAYVRAAVKPWGDCNCTTVWTDYYWTTSGTMP